MIVEEKALIRKDESRVKIPATGIAYGNSRSKRRGRTLSLDL